jgi:hypothetical protein
VFPHESDTRKTSSRRNEGSENLFVNQDTTAVLLSPQDGKTVSLQLQSHSAGVFYDQSCTMNQDQEPTQRKPDGSHDQSRGSSPLAHAMGVRESSSHSHSDYRHIKDILEENINSVAASDQQHTKRKASARNFVLVPPLNCRESRRPCNDESHQEGEQSEDQQYLLLPRPTLQTWNSLKLFSEVANDVSCFSGNNDFSSPASSNVRSNNTSRNSGTVDAQELATPTNTMLDGIIEASGMELNNLDRTDKDLPLLDVSISPFSLLPNFTPPRTIAATTSGSYPKLQLLQRKDKRSNPFSADNVDKTTATVMVDEREQSNQPSLRPHAANFLVNVDERKAMNALNTGESMNSQRSEACDQVQTIDHEVNESSYYTPTPGDFTKP